MANEKKTGGVLALPPEIEKKGTGTKVPLFLRETIKETDHRVASTVSPKVMEPKLHSARLITITSGGSQGKEPRVSNYRLGLIYADEAQIFITAQVLKAAGRYHVAPPSNMSDPDGPMPWQALDPSSTEDLPVLNFFGNMWQGHPSGIAGSGRRGIPLITGLSLGQFWDYLEQLATRLEEPEVAAFMKEQGFWYTAGRGNMTFECIALPLEWIAVENRLITILGKRDEATGLVSFDVTRQNCWTGGEQPSWATNPSPSFDGRSTGRPARQYVGGKISTSGTGQRIAASLEYLGKSVEIALAKIKESGVDVDNLTTTARQSSSGSGGSATAVLKRLYGEPEKKSSASVSPKLGKTEGLAVAPDEAAFSG